MSFLIVIQLLMRSRRREKLQGVDSAGSLGLLAATVAVSCSRVSLGYHTVRQVLAGILAGSLFAFIWWKVLDKVIENRVLQVFIVRVKSSMSGRVLKRGTYSG